MSDTLTETTADGAEGVAVDIPEEAPGVAESGTETAALVAAEESAAPPWAPSQEDWQALTGTVQTLAQQLAPAAPAAPEPPSFTTTDETTGETYIDPAALQRYIDHQVQQGIQQGIGPYAPALNEVTSSTAETAISGELESLKTTLGTFDVALARELAEGYATTDSDWRQAVRKGAERAAEFARTQAQTAVEEYKKTLGNIGEAPREPGANGAGVEGYETPKGPGGYKAVADAWESRHGFS